MIEPVDPIVMCYCEFFAVKWVLWFDAIMLVDQAFCKPLDIDVAGGPVGKKGKSIPRIHVCSY